MLGALLLIFHYVRIYLRTEKYLVKWTDLSSCRKIGYQSTSQNGGQYFPRCIFLKNLFNITLKHVKCTCFLSDLDRNNSRKVIFFGHMCTKHVER